MNINAIKIKTLRTEKNWTQQTLSEACGVSLRTIQRVERYGNASQETVMALASVLEVPQSELIVPETPVVELEIAKPQSSTQIEQVVKFAVTLLTGIIIGAGLMNFFR